MMPYSWSLLMLRPFWILSAIAVVSPAQTFTTLASFNGPNGYEPQAPLVQGNDGNLYGTTFGGGAHGVGTIFKIAPGGTLTTLYSFGTAMNDGGAANGLIQASDGNFYGTSANGGADNGGTVFKITPGGTLTTLHSFSGPDGYTPVAALVQGADGNFYGTTNYSGKGAGTVFKITPGGR
jgi:uncharacterized repeat protein (TIGR03803 family)